MHKKRIQRAKTALDDRSQNHLSQIESQTQNPQQNSSEFQQFISTLHASSKKWERYRGVLTNDTKFDSSALLNKYKTKRN